MKRWMKSSRTRTTPYAWSLSDLIVSSAQNEIADMKRLGLDIAPHRKRMNDEALDEKFKDSNNPLRLVFVRSDCVVCPKRDCRYEEAGARYCSPPETNER